MKQIILLTVLLFSFLSSDAQKYIDEITDNICHCIEKIPDSLDLNQKKIELGLCMINASIPYKKKLKKDFDIDLDIMDETTGERYGQFFGLKIAGHCPNMIKKFADINNDNKKEIKTETDIANGIIIKINKDFFVNFSLKDINGKINKFYWLSFIKSNTELQETFESLKGKNVKIKYTVQDFFDPRINEYREFKIITELIVID